MQKKSNPSFSLPDAHKGRLPFEPRWSTRLNLLEKNLRSTLFHPKGITADQLARQRLETQLAVEVKKVKLLLDQLEDLQKKYPALMEEFKQLRRESEQEILSFEQRVHELEEEKQILEEEKKVKGEEASNMVQQMDRLRETQKKSLEKQAKYIEHLLSENHRLEKKMSEMKKHMRLMEEQLKKKAEEFEMTFSEIENFKVGFPQIEKKKNSPSGSVTVGGDVPMGADSKEKNQNKSEKAEKVSGNPKHYIKRFLQWWIEPVASIPFPLVLSSMKSKEHPLNQGE